MSGVNVYKWSTIDRIGTTILTFLGNVLMARMLTAADFGLLAMVGIFTAVAYNMTSCGMSDGLIRKLKPTELDYSTVFVFNSAIGFVFGLAFYISAPYMAKLFGQPPLIDIMRVIGICFAIQSMSLVQETKLRKELRMKAMAFVHICSTVCAVGLGVVLVWLGYGYWGLVSCRIFLSVFIFIFSLMATRWFPKVNFSMDSFREFFSFGFNLMLSFIFTQIARNINSTVLGKQSPTASGIYSQAQKMQEVPTGIIDNSIIQPFYPVAANTSDEGERHKTVHAMFSISIMINVTVMLLLFLLSRPGFVFLFGEKWLESVPVFRILLVFGFLYNMKSFIIEVMKLHSKTRMVRNLTIVEVVVQLLLLVVFYQYGILWIAASQVLSIVLIGTLYLAMFKRYENVNIKDIVRMTVYPSVGPLISFVIAGAGYLMLMDVINNFVMICFATVVYAFSLYVCMRCIPCKTYKLLLSRFKLN